VKDQKVIPTHVGNSINYRFFFIMISSITAFHYLVNFMDDKEAGEFILSIFSVVNPTITGLAALIVSFRYQSTGLGLGRKHFRYSYIIFSAAFLAAAGGEILYFVYDYLLDEPAFPSPADILFFPFYPLILVYLYLNASFSKPEFGLRHIWIIILPTFIIIFYHILIGKREQDFQFFLSQYYIVVSAISLSFTIFATLIFKNSFLEKTWLLTLLGIIPFTVADVVYYNLEAIDGYDLAHPVNLLWYTGYWIITYALYKHPSNKTKNEGILKI
jgi:hypothetical protein